MNASKVLLHPSPSSPDDHVHLGEDAHVVIIPKRVSHPLGKSLKCSWIVLYCCIAFWLQNDWQLVFCKQGVATQQSTETLLVSIVTDHKLPLLLIRSQHRKEALDDRV